MTPGAGEPGEPGLGARRCRGGSGSGEKGGQEFTVKSYNSSCGH